MNIIKEIEEIWHAPFKTKISPTFVLVFAGCYIYSVIEYGLLFGVGLGWLPSIIIAFAALKVLPALAQRTQRIVAKHFPKFRRFTYFLIIFLSFFAGVFIVSLMLGQQVNQAIIKALAVSLLPVLGIGLKILSNKFDKILFQKT